MTTTSQKIDGRTITLESGRRYVASRPFRGTGNPEIRITDITNCGWVGKRPVLVIPMGWAAADRFLAAFNNGETSFEGRIWN